MYRNIAEKWSFELAFDQIMPENAASSLQQAFSCPDHSKCNVHSLYFTRRSFIAIPWTFLIVSSLVAAFGLSEVVASSTLVQPPLNSANEFIYESEDSPCTFILTVFISLAINPF